MKSKREIEFSKPLYQAYLLSTLPKALRTYITSEDKQQSGTQLSYLLRDFKNDMLYFKYAHSKIYDQLLSALATIEHCIVQDEVSKSNPTTLTLLNDSFHKIYKAFLFDLPDDRIDSYFKFK